MPHRTAPRHTAPRRTHITSHHHQPPLLAPQNVKSLQNYEIMQVTDSHFMARKYTPFLQVNDKL